MAAADCGAAQSESDDQESFQGSHKIRGSRRQERVMTNDDRFQALYRKYYKRMVRFYVLSFRVTEEDAEELTQDAFFRFLEAMDEYRGDAEWAYLEVIARNVAYNRIRSQKTAKRGAETVDIHDRNAMPEPAAPTLPDYAQREESALRSKRLRDAMPAFHPAAANACSCGWTNLHTTRSRSFSGSLWTRSS